MIFKSTSFFVTLLLITLNTFSQRKLSLNDAIELISKNNLLIKQANLRETLSAYEVQKARSGQYPSLNASTNIQTNYGRSLDPTIYNYVENHTITTSESISSSLTVFQGLQKLNQIRQNKFLLESNKNETQKATNDLTIEIIAVYLSILDLKNQLKIAENQKHIAEQQVDFETKEYQQGKKMLADLSRARYQLQKTITQITGIENQLTARTVDLLQTLNIDPSTPIEFKEPDDTLNIYHSLKTSQIFKSACEFLPEIKQAETDKQAAKLGVAIAKGYYYPTVTVSALVASNFSHQSNFNPSLFLFPQLPFFSQLHNNMYEYVGLNINVPIFNSFNAKFAVKKAKINLENANINGEIAYQNLYKVVSQANSDLLAAEKNFNTSKESWISAKDIYDAVKKRYLSGRSSSLDFNQAQNDMNQAEFTLIHDKYDFIFKQKVIDFYLGRKIFY